ncbi:MAG: gliding motility-associated ABC transporter permease subunit GldF [Flavobacteriaceae bacterium]
MIALIKKEFHSFFATPIGYLVIGVFLILNGLFLWVFSGNFNIFDNGFADLAPFFELAPWVFIFLIPAVTMRAFSEEKRMGTLELLLTKPISLPQIILGKFFGALLLISMALIPTVLFVFTISDLGNPPGNWDFGSTFGSYIGLLFLAIAYCAIGIFSSTLSENQIVAFIIAVLLCFFMYYGFDGITSAISAIDVSFLGMQTHFNSIARGVLDTRDILFFLSVTALFLVFTFLNLKKSNA